MGVKMFFGRIAMGLYVHTYLDKQKEDFIMSDARIQQFSEKLKALSHPCLLYTSRCV